MTIIEFTKEWDNWNPGYYDYKKNCFIPYDKSYFCNENKVIHSNLKQILNCKCCFKQFL